MVAQEKIRVEEQVVEVHGSCPEHAVLVDGENVPGPFFSCCFILVEKVGIVVVINV